MPQPGRTAFFSHETFFWHEAGRAAVFVPAGGYVEPGEHVESPATKRRLRNLLEASGLLKELDTPGFEPATDEEILCFHTREHLDRVKKVSAQGGGETGEFTPISGGGFEIAARSAGAAIAATDLVLKGQARNAYSLSRPPGHHAEASCSRGFCVFGNLVIAAMLAQKTHGLGRIAVVDWDVHHGNGTQSAFYERDDVLTVSIHQNGLFPNDSGFVEERGAGRGKGCNLNIPLPAGSGHEAYVQVMRDIVIPQFAAFKPDLVMVACGYDAGFTDPLGRMLCHSETFRNMTAQVMELADTVCDGRLVMTHEGGYSDGLVPFCGLAVLEQMSGIRTPCEDPFLELAVNYPDQKLREDQQALINRINGELY